ncbi:AAA family ATPase [Phycicoccus sp. KQZ13P-1]|uniref:AAA family ATPase n=1 Tax=Phycicoccus mangrovi TaxID=2840470 RepID=UPI001C002F36|nr:AAA family ATPase [Phycicoccus mangrovi]MBT9255311.1 AAA family ATPase [Phycicoccus mangrovi]
MTLLRLDSINLVGADRRIDFSSGLNVVSGDIASGKTTLVRVLRAVLGSKPRHLPPETARITQIQALLRIGTADYSMSRPFVTTDTAPVDITGSGEALRLPASRATIRSSDTFGTWLLRKLDIPAVEVPTARTKATSTMTPVTINDWLNYCFVPGDEIDVMVFGHKDPFRDMKRRYVFEINYGLYNFEAAEVEAGLRQIERRLESLGRQSLAAAAFLAHTPFADLAEVQARRDQTARALADLADRPNEIAADATVGEGAAAIRQQYLLAQKEASDAKEAAAAAARQISDLQDLISDLTAQAGRLNRAIVSAELLSDIDFVVCPRCGQGVEASERDQQGHCRLCLQEVHESDAPAAMSRELDRIYAQISETQGLLDRRLDESHAAAARANQLEAIEKRLDISLRIATNSFVSSAADEISATAKRQARLESDLERFDDYLELYEKNALIDQEVALLEDERNDLLSQLESAKLDSAYQNVRELERTFSYYLERLHSPLVEGAGSATLNRTTYLPEVAGRTFDALSSQGLATLVNVAHALAHHTTSIRLGLPLPGLLVLDGLSSNLGSKDFDAARVDDMYTLIREVAEEYAEHLQVIVFDNDPPPWILSFERARLTQDSRLILTADE